MESIVPNGSDTQDHDCRRDCAECPYCVWERQQNCDDPMCHVGAHRATRGLGMIDNVEPTITPDADWRPVCSTARFGRPHRWITGAFYWPLGSPDSRLYVGDDYVMCGSCGQIEAEQ